MAIFSLERIFRLSEFCPLGCVLGDISWDNFLGHLIDQENYQDANCPRICTGIGWYFCTYDDTYLISLYAKVCVRYGIFLYIRLSTPREIVPACPGRDRFHVKHNNF